ncbi:MAG: flagellar basal body L-ring protein FlgH [Thermodesulfovibrionales bacterium]|jgi:flagellar L-ring protein precursor FlgH
MSVTGLGEQITILRNKIVVPGCLLAAIGFLLAACATTPHLPPPPEKYVHKEEKIEPTPNSLWRESASIYDDLKARRLNDLVTIIVLEDITGSGTANSKTDRTSSISASTDSVFGLNPTISGLKFLGGSKSISPSMSGSMADAFQGDGATSREGTVGGTITAKVVEVMPNGNLVVESRKELTINAEKHILILRGMIRPEDIASNNTIQSSQVADAEIYFVGKGILQDKVSPGWLMQLADKIWPF